MTKLGELAAADARLGPGGWEAEGQDVVDENGTLLCRVNPPTVVAYLAACEPARIQRLLAVLEAGYEGVAHSEWCTTVHTEAGDCDCPSAELLQAVAECRADPLLAPKANTEASKC